MHILQRVSKCVCWCSRHLSTHLHMHGAQQHLSKCISHSPQKMHMRSCMHAYATVQKLLYHETIANLSWVLREHRAGCRLPLAQPLSRPNPSPDAVRSRNSSKSTLAHDAVAAAVLHKHHSIIRVGAGLIQFVYGSHSRLATGVPSSRILFWPFFRARLSGIKFQIRSFSHGF